ncbi:hypothetical protein quinque_003400 [Culex quinquefasciatus]
MHVLDALKSQYTTLASHQASKVNPFKLEILSKNLANIEHGLDEAHLITTLATMLQSLEIEKERLRLQVKRLHQESAWLREELSSAQKRLQTSEEEVIQLQEDKKHLEFTLSLKKYEDNEDHPLEKSHVDLIEELFTEDCSDGRSPTPPSQYSGYETPPRLRTLYNLVIEYASQGRYEVAVPLCQQALDDLEKTSGHNHPDVATMLNILALVYRDQEKYREAVKLLIDALAIREKVLGENHPAVAATLNNLAVLYGKCGKYKDAEPLCRRALIIRRNVLGEDHPDVAKQLTNLALICENLQKYTEVEKFYRKALEIYEAKLGPEDPNVNKTKHNLGNCYVKLGEYQKAEALYNQILTNAPPITPTKDNQESPKPGKSSEAPANSQQQKDQSPAYREYGDWHKAAPADSPTVAKTLKKLRALRKKQAVMVDSTDSLKDCALRSKKKALELVARAKAMRHNDKTVVNELWEESFLSLARRAPPPPPARKEIRASA